MPVSFSVPSLTTVALSLFVMFTFQVAISNVMRYTHAPAALFPLLAPSKQATPQSSTTLDDSAWHPPLSSGINNLETAINGTGVYGFVFTSSTLPKDVKYGTYNWCNMPHVRATEYSPVNSSFSLEYVEIIHRHHKRTPYASNTFPEESYPWNCDDEALFFYGAPFPASGANQTAPTYWNVYTSPSNPLAPAGFNGTCQFPQITRGGLDDSWQHGRDIFGVYSDLLHFIPSTYDPATVSYRVTNNVITSQVSSMLIGGMHPDRSSQITPLLIQPASIDSLEPSYSCPAARNLYSSYGPGSNAPDWHAHLDAAAPLYAALDAISSVSSNDAAWHNSVDHYFDNLSARLCHAKPLPCSIADPSQCVTQAQAYTVFRLGEYEYDYIYRSAGPQTLTAAIASYGIWVAELAQNLRDAMDGQTSDAAGAEAEKAAGKIKYRHNVAHDGSVARLLSILQVETMVWPGMGAEIVFELYKATSQSSTGNREYFVRVLWGGQVLRSSHPALGAMDMVSVQTVLAYFDALVGVGATKIPGLCNDP